VAVSPGLSLVAPQALATQSVSALQAGLTTSIGEFPALPAVGDEIREIHALVGGKTLLDASFVRAALDRELAAVPYEIVHLASHAQFGDDLDSTFLLTFDGRMRFAELGELVQRAQFRERPLELLTLSACQTAAGDERAALGLAGLAVQSGARSTLASLWSVNDPATARLMMAFYRSLLKRGTSRAEAIRRAQRELLGTATYRHPAYWSPFLLIGSWR